MLPEGIEVKRLLISSRKSKGLFTLRANTQYVGVFC